MSLPRVPFPSELGRSPSVRGVQAGVLRVRRGNGSLLHVALADFPEKLLKHVAANQWPAALQVSQYSQGAAERLVGWAFAICERNCITIIHRDKQ